MCNSYWATLTESGQGIYETGIDGPKASLKLPCKLPPATVYHVNLQTKNWTGFFCTTPGAWIPELPNLPLGINQILYNLSSCEYTCQILSVKVHTEICCSCNKYCCNIQPSHLSTIFHTIFPLNLANRYSKRQENSFQYHSWNHQRLCEAKIDQTHSRTTLKGELLTQVTWESNVNFLRNWIKCMVSFSS